GPAPYTTNFTCSRSKISGANVAETFPSIPNHSLVKYVMDVLIPTALALKMDERNRIQSTPIASSQRIISPREYKNFGLGGGAPGSAGLSGTANAVATTGASIAFAALTGGRKNGSLAVMKLIDDGLGTLLAAKPCATFTVSLGSPGAISCACAIDTLPSTSIAAAKSLILLLPSEGWPHALGLATLLR